MIPQREVTYALSLATVQVTRLPRYSVLRDSHPLRSKIANDVIRYFKLLQPFLIHQH